MESEAADKPVRRKIEALLSDERLILGETQRAVTPFGGIAIFISFLNKSALWKRFGSTCRSAGGRRITLIQLPRSRPFWYRCWGEPDASLTRVCCEEMLRCTALLGLEHFPTDDTIGNLFRRFGMGEVQRLFAPLAEWQRQRLPQRAEGYTLDLDSTVLC